MSSRNELRNAIEDALVKHGVEKYVFAHSKKHANVTWWLNGKVRFYTFPLTSPSSRMRHNTVADIRRHCKAMLAATENRIGLS